MFWEAFSAANQCVSVRGLVDCMIIAVIFKQEKGIYKDMCICAHVFWPRLKTGRQTRQSAKNTIVLRRTHTRILGVLGCVMTGRPATCPVPAKTAKK